ncbi:MAG: DTW domain-containing protein [Cellvibrionaceae bacterium]
MTRAYCLQCLRPQSACYCHLVHSATPKTAVTILQHPLEVKNAKNTARLLHLCLSGSELLDSEHWETIPVKSGRTPVLLYPSSGEEGHPSIDIKTLEGETTQLIALDGTWRKTRKMLHLSPALQRLPRLTVSFPETSQYRIRKAPNEKSLSTFEAVYQCLQQLEPNWDPEEQLLKSFNGFLDLWDSLNLNPNQKPE